MRHTGTPRSFDGKVYEENAPHDMAELLEILKILRSPEGCRWDRAQTLESLKKCLTDETEEVLAAIDRKDGENLCEELGDVLLEVLLMSGIAEEQGMFTFGDVVQSVSEKMIRRHPHVFGDITDLTEEEFSHLWHDVKAEEKRRKAERKARKEAQAQKARTEEPEVQVRKTGQEKPAEQVQETQQAAAERS